MFTRFLRLLAILALLLPAAIANTASAAEYLTSEQTTALGLPFSDAVRAGGLLILSGQLGNLPGSMQLAPGGIRAEARQALENVKRILEANGSGMDRVVKCTVMMADIAEWGTFNEVYVTYFPGPKPARSAFAASGLAAGARVELECWAEA
ncbi:MAG: RidA family protein [Pseudomonadales bacterium]